MQLSISRGSRKIKSIPRDPGGISGNEICNGVPFISATWTLKKFFIVEIIAKIQKKIIIVA